MGFNIKDNTFDFEKLGIRVYIASAYTVGDVAVNVRAQMTMYDYLLSVGLYPYAPLWSHFQHMHAPRDYETWMRVDFKWLEVCDCLLRLPGESKGADREIKHAEDLGIPVFYSVTELLKYYTKIQKEVKNV